MNVILVVNKLLQSCSELFFNRCVVQSDSVCHVVLRLSVV